MRRLGIVITVVMVVVPAFAGVVEDSGIKGGIVVQVGCKNGKSLANLLVNNRFLVHGLDVDAKRIEEVRHSLRSDRRYGRISAAVFDGENLPYTDNLINLLVIEDPQCRIEKEEMIRVLVPGGVAMVGGKKITKSVPSNIDEWTHFLHGADNNAVANDTVVAAPRTIQWVSNPRWGRSHEEAASVSALVTTNGRVFAIMDEAPNISIRFMADWKLAARDAFNGTLLWKKDIPVWSDHLRHFRAGPTHLPRRLVAVGDKVYVTLGLDAPVSILDAATGETLKVLKGTERTEEIAVDGGVVYLAIGTSEVYRWGGGLHARGEPKATDFRYIMAVDPDSGRQLWKKDFTGTNFLLPMSMTVRNGSVFYQDINGVGRLDARTGTEIWEKKRPTVARRMSFASPTVVATDDILLVADRIPKINSNEPQQMAATDKIEWGVHGWNEDGFARRNPNLLVAYSVEDGEVLWSKPCSESYNSAVDVFVVGDNVHIGGGWERYDLKTGEKQGPDVKMSGGKVGMAHHRCYRNKASVRYVFTGRSGIEVADMEKGWLGNNSWIRGTCQYGIMPANGMLYAPPDACGCFNKVKVQGFFAAAPARESKPVQISDAERLRKGPAYGKISDSQAADDEDWPMYRRDGQRSGGIRTTVSGKPKKLWSAKLAGRLTQPVVVGDTVYLAQTDSHTVYALNAANGQEKWSFTVDGRVDSTPTVYKGMVLFGSADGWLYCLRAADGALAWKFLAAPEIRLVSSYGQLESVWPVHGSVLIQNDALYTSAGRNTYLDDGITFYKMDPVTGKVLNKNVLYNFDPVTGEQLGPEEGRFDMDGVNTALLTGDGQNVFMKQERLDGSLQKLDKSKPHLFGIHGFLGEEWFVRSYWLLGTNVRAGWGGWASGNETTFGRIMTFDDENAYGYGRVMIASAAVGHNADDYHLYGVKKVLMTTGLPRPRRKKGQKSQPPDVKRPLKPEPFWADTQSLIVRAMVLANDKLVVAGPPDLRRKEAGILAYSNETESLAAFKGQKGVMLRLVNKANGTTISEQKLDAMPVFDGMSAAHGRMFMSLKNGELQCWR